MIKLVYILIGAPGSGKSTTTRKITSEAAACGLSTAEHSADSFFVNAAGEYRFDFRQLGEFHSKNQVAFLRSLIRGINVICVDNTNLSREHRDCYAIPAREAGYEVVYQTVGEFTPESLTLYASRNIHGVPADKVFKMAKWYQPVNDEEKGLIK